MRKLLLSGLLLLAPACGSSPAEAPDAAPPEHASAAITAAVSAAPAASAATAAAESRVAGVKVADFKLDDAIKMDPLLAPLGWVRMMGCGESSAKGRQVACRYGKKAINVVLARGAKKLPIGAAVDIPVDATTHLLAYAKGGPDEEAEAQLRGLYDAKERTLAGVKIAAIKDAEGLEKALSSKGFTGERFDGATATVLFAAERADVTLGTRMDESVVDNYMKVGKISRDSAGAIVAVVVAGYRRPGTVADPDRILAALLTAP
jgi:predicted regulator of Ras-like GTPase activity (Roadblock/LC7/MglB family)